MNAKRKNLSSGSCVCFPQPRRGAGQLVPCRKAVTTPRFSSLVLSPIGMQLSAGEMSEKTKQCREFDSHLNLFIFEVPRA